MIVRRVIAVLLLISCLTLVASKTSPITDSKNDEPPADSLGIIEEAPNSKLGNDELPTVEFLNNALLQKEPPCSNKNINNIQEKATNKSETKSKIQEESPNSPYIETQDPPISPMVLHRTVLPSGRTLYYLFPPWTGGGSTTTTAVATTTTTTTTEAPTTTSLPPPLRDASPISTPIVSQPLGMPIFRHQMKFVVPVHVSKLEEQPKMIAVPGDSVSKFGLDPYAYFPSYLRPRYVQMTLPYTPTYHMIRTLQVPSDHSAQYIMNNVGYQ